jgi:hypothetical protein
VPTRHESGACQTCQAPMSAQNASCWRCNTRRADAPPPLTFAAPQADGPLLRFGATVPAGPAVGRRRRVADL